MAPNWHQIIVWGVPFLAATGRIPPLGFSLRTRHRNRKAFTLLAQLLLARRVLFYLLDLLRTLRRKGLKKVGIDVVGWIMSYARQLPVVRGIAAKEKQASLDSIKKDIIDGAPSCGDDFSVLPSEGIAVSTIQSQLALARGVQQEYDDDKAMGGIYHGEKDAHGLELGGVQAEAMKLFSSTNALYPGVFPGIRKFESEIIAMVVDMMGGAECWSGAENACGIFTSGGTESVLMAALAHREYYRDNKGITEPEIIACTSAHAAIDKACHYFGIRLIHVEPNPNTMAASVDIIRREINANTIMVYTSAPSFPHGVIDPIVDIAAMAHSYGIGCHVDNCLGGFLYSSLYRQGLVTTPFDLRVKGVTSISVDAHKYGYAPKGGSCVVYSNPEIRRSGYTTVTDWSGGLYCTHAMGGSRGGHIMAATWATMINMGKGGYDREARIVHTTFQKVLNGVKAMKGIQIMGNPSLSIVAFTSDEFDIYKVADVMKHIGQWEMARMQRPPCVHICVNVRTASIVDQWLLDLEKAVEMCRGTEAQGIDGMAGIYGQAGIVPDRSVVSEILKGYLDTLLMTKK
jgi:sphinganine-1-phosphate aldolase